MLRVYDVTYLAHWGGRITGIPRVISEVVARSAGDESARFVVWEKATRRFVEVDPVRTVEHRGHGVQYVTRDTAGFRLTRAVKHFGTGFLSRALASLGRRTGSTGLADLAVRVAKWRDRNHVVVEAGAGHIFVSFMGEWHDDHYIDEVVAIHGRGAKVVQTIYDLLPIVTPQSSGHSTVPMTRYLTRVMPVADLVVAISEHTKRDLTAWTEAQGIRTPRIEVFRIGDDFSVDRDREPSRAGVPAHIEPGRFILCVGTVEARKNHVLLYYVYRLAKRRGIELPHLVIVGREGYRAGDIFHILQEDPELAGGVTLLSDLDDEGLAWLYRNCRFTVYPSMYEGWGLPIAESLAWGKPVIASGTSSMPEIAGDLVDYIDPFSVDECLASIARLNDDSELQGALARVARYRPTTWDETTRTLETLIAGVAGESA